MTAKKDKATKVDNSERQAKAQFDSIRDMVTRLEHAQYCQDVECDLSDAEICAGLGLYYVEGHPTYGRKATGEERNEYHDEDKARRMIEEGPLSVEVRSDWHTLGRKGGEEPSEYCILLCTGGPACRIIGDLGADSEPTTARLEHQDWFTPWREYRLDSEEEKTLLVYAQQFYYGG